MLNQDDKDLVELDSVVPERAHNNETVSNKRGDGEEHPVPNQHLSNCCIIDLCRAVGVLHFAVGKLMVYYQKLQKNCSVQTRAVSD